MQPSTGRDRSGFSMIDATTAESSPAELWAKCMRLCDENDWLKSQLGDLQQIKAENMALKASRKLMSRQS